MARKVRYQTVNVTFPSGTAAAIQSAVKITTDAAYQHVEGIGVFESADGGIPTYKIGITSDAGTDIQERTDKRDWLSGSVSDTQIALAHKDRYKAVDGMAAGGRVYKISVETEAVLTDDLSFDMVLKLVTEE